MPARIAVPSRFLRPFRTVSAAFLGAFLFVGPAFAAAQPAAKPKTPAVKTKPAATVGGVSVSTQYRSPRNAQRPLRKATQFIVLHTTEGAAKGALEKLSKNGECHYVVDTAGRLYSIVDKGRVAYHAGLSMWDGRTGLDSCSIGIEVVGYHDKDITAAQYATLKKLLADLKSTYGIPDVRVLTHSMVAFGNPNHWQKKKHRGRKRCGMNLAAPEARAKMGLLSKPAFDPDLKAKRLVDADPELTRILYRQAPSKPAPAKPAPPSSSATAAAPAAKPAAPAAKPAAPAAKPAAGPAKPPPSPSNVIGPKRSAWDIARDQYDAATTVYTFPNGTRKTGAEISAKEWRSMPAGTTVETNAGGDASENGNEGLLTIGTDGTALELAGDALASQSTFYFPPGADYRTGATMALSDIDKLPAGTRLLVDYKVAGPISAKRPVFSLCGVAWNRGDTYYWNPAKKTLTSGEDISERNIPLGAMVFFRK